ncbi:choline-sulfatase [Paralimibaculum aggregatum]|uniref:Choline-sulfatase n=1 Tax=Paralimibaculum aggregatum TaxID=3036245 RepID=A0ABQ6LH07_9RHOB|nr:choline-sulfatase [Limibaculum sp. NKW23]GMG81701.1 choline-sulfatase [Limibaculum sp. NKW23]
MTPPNIVLVMADQLAPQFTGAYGHPLVRTPHMEALAARGARFDAAYCNAPLCAPSRFSFMSGQHVTRIAAYDNASEFPAAIPTFAHYLRRMGYRTCLSGKMHFVGPDQLHGFEERLTTDIYPADHAWTPDWELPDERIDSFYHNMDAVQNAGMAATTFQIEYDEETAFFARRRIFEYAMDKVRPFAMVVSFIHPHDPYVARPEWWNLYDHDAIDMPGSPLATDPHSRRLMHGIEADVAAPGEAQIRNARHAYYANTSYFDSKLGAIVQALEESDQLDNTVIVVTADHGDMLGERGLWYKMTFFEHSGRVPLIIAGPGIAQAEIAAPCSLVDILPTFLDIAAQGGEAPALGMPVDGRSLLPMAAGGPEDDGEAIGEYCAECASHPVFMIRRGRFKYIHCDVDPPQLFDLVADPAELANLAEDPAHAAVAAGFAAEVARRWDSEAIRSHVIATQRQRRAVHAAMEAGLVTSWDYQPKRDAATEFVRNNVSWDDVLNRMQYPAPGRPMGAKR